MREVEQKPGWVVVKFSAQWCGPCKAVALAMANMPETMKEVTFVTVDVEQAEDVVRRLGVRTVPTLTVFHDGVIIDSYENSKGLGEEAIRKGLQTIMDNYNTKEKADGI